MRPLAVVAVLALVALHLAFGLASDDARRHGCTLAQRLTEITVEEQRRDDGPLGQASALVGRVATWLDDACWPLITEKIEPRFALTASRA